MALASWQTAVFALAFQRMEIITGVGRRRSWSSEEKVRLVGEVAERGVAEVARRYEVCRSLLYRWRRQMRRGELAAVTAAAGFAAVRVAPEVPAVRETRDELPAAPAPPESTLGSGAPLGLVEIVLGNGRVLPQTAPPLTRRPAVKCGSRDELPKILARLSVPTILALLKIAQLPTRGLDFSILGR